MKITKLTSVRIAELRDCHNPVFDELLDVLEAQTEEYQRWLEELDGPTPEAKIESLAKSFDTEQRCTECGELMRAPVSLWRCSVHPNEHQAVGPGIAFEIRLKAAARGSR